MVFQRKLPDVHFEQRIQNEINMLEKNGCTVERDKNNLIITFSYPGYYRNKLGDESNNKEGTPTVNPEIRNNHKIKISIPRSYPFLSIDSTMVVWMTPIFHPNINEPPPIGNGFICLAMLKQSNISNLKSFVDGLKVLLAEPNLEDPLYYKECLLAKEYFESHPESLEALKRMKTAEMDSDIIIITEDSGNVTMKPEFNIPVSNAETDNILIIE